jgi:predicted CoA-binding protein
LSVSKTTLVIGASTNPERYSFLAVKKLLQHGHAVKAIGAKKGTINNINIETEQIPFNDIDTVTLYIGQSIQESYYDYILNLHPKRIIFNPGTENTYFFKLASSNKIICLNACTLVMLSTKQF